MATVQQQILLLLQPRRLQRRTAKPATFPIDRTPVAALGTRPVARSILRLNPKGLASNIPIIIFTQDPRYPSISILANCGELYVHS